jgi:hypothetical protein
MSVSETKDQCTVLIICSRFYMTVRVNRPDHTYFMNQHMNIRGVFYLNIFEFLDSLHFRKTKLFGH